jgi:hypothetical protein
VNLPRRLAHGWTFHSETISFAGMHPIARWLGLSSVCLLLDAGRAQAQSSNRWLVLSTGDPTLSLDTTTVAKSPDGFPRVWIRMIYKTPRSAGTKTYVRVMWRVDFNCILRQTNDVESIEYAANGSVVQTIRPPITSWTDAVPETIAESALNGFCKTSIGRS